MTTPADIQSLLRFLNQSASIPLSRAMALIPLLRQAQLTTIPAIAAHPLPDLRTLLFPDDEKAAKQLHNAAKRASSGGAQASGKRKSAAANDLDINGRKRRRKSPTNGEPSPAEIEAELVLPAPDTVDEEVLRSTALYTNRAPLLLAFAVMLLKYTTPEQPLSSRLSLAQAMVSAGARARAYNLGIEKTKGAEDEGWGVGQPTVKVMGKDVRVLKRWGYDVGGGGEAETAAGEPVDVSVAPEDATAAKEDVDEIGNVKDEETKRTPASANNATTEIQPALWGLDLEALKKFNTPPLVNASSHGTSSLPIHRPESARAYLLKSFATASVEDNEAPVSSTKLKPKQIAEEKERNLGFLLAALDLLYQSWTSRLTAEELDRRAWTWYVAVRPNVEEGAAGWGGKNKVRLAQILDLKRPA